MFLRDGIDKIMLTIRPKDLSLSYKTPELVAQRYKVNGNKSTLKFSDGFSSVIVLEKYLWQGKPSIKYALRLNQFRQCRVYVNLMRYYNVKNDLDFYTMALFDNNVVVPSRMFDTMEFVDIMKELIKEITLDYIMIRDYVFNDVITIPEITIDTHQLEFVNEAIGCHVNDLADVFLKYSKVDSVVRFFNHTQTIYLNDHRKQQLKIYQKGVGIMRLEMTFNDRVQDTICDWNAPTIVIADRLRDRYDRTLKKIGIPSEWWEQRNMSLESFVRVLSEALKLTSIEEVNASSVDLMKVLLTSTSFKYSDMNKNLIQKLVRKRLIQQQSYGYYEPTDRLKELQMIYNRLKRMEEIEFDTR